MGWLDALRGRGTPPSEDEIIVVSGLPRSGTSMMMRILEKAGVPLLTDGLREPDSDNPRGYYELERVKALRSGDTAWLRDAAGHAVKIVSEHLRVLPPLHRYRILFMERDLTEVLISQRKMLSNRSEPEGAGDRELADRFASHLEEIRAWLTTQRNIRVHYVSYADVLADPLPHLERVNRFLGGTFDVDRMASAVDPTLYRSRP